MKKMYNKINLNIIKQTTIKKFSWAMLFYCQYLQIVLSKFIEKINLTKNEITVWVTPKHLLFVTKFLKNHTSCQYKSLIEICAVDFPDKKKRFEIVYQLISYRYNNRIQIKTCLSEKNSLDSLHELFSSCLWYEREVWEMNGIFFKSHPDLRRILTDYGFKGFPLRKDFPMTGYTDIRYNDATKRLVHEPLELSQEFRYFDFSNPWEVKELKCP